MKPLIKGRRVRYDSNYDTIVEEFEGYYMTIDELIRLCRDFQADCHDGFVSNDHAYIMLKMEQNE